MTQDQFRTIEILFHNAMACQSGRERERFIDEQCPAEFQTTLRGWIEADELQARSESQAEDHRVYGPYRTEAVLGTGGSGIVYRAARADREFEHSVALKVLRSTARSEWARSRFRIERQILAQLKHRNIAALYDGGVTPEGEPYVVIEYVEGEPLDRYCDARRLSNGERLRIFEQVLDAVAYAHRNLVIHGDLKPSNILVDKNGVVKLLDFGTSRFLDDESGTLTAAAMTPEYASPEQLRGERLTMASDVFSLGLILYELLTGAKPFAAGPSLMAVIERGIKETDPAAPDTVVTVAAADSRNAGPEQLRKELRGDLAGIVMKALAFDPARRYGLVVDLAADLDNFAAGRPVMARPQTQWYRTLKFVKRNRTSVAAAAAVLIAVVGSGAYGYRQQRTALEQARRAKVLNTFLMRLFQAVSPASGGRWNMPPAEVMDRAEVLAETMLRNEPESDSEFLLALAPNVGLTRGFTAAGPLLRRAVEQAHAAGNTGLEASGDALMGYYDALNGNCDAARERQRTAEALESAGRRTISQEWRLFIDSNAIGIMETCGGEPPARLRARAEQLLAETRALDEASVELGIPPRSLKTTALHLAAQAEDCRTGRQHLDELLAITPGDPLLKNQEFYGYSLLGACEMAAGNWTPAQGAFEKALADIVEIMGDQWAGTMVTHARLAYVLAQQSQTARALDEARKSIAADDARMPSAGRYIRPVAAAALVMAEDLRDGEAVARQALSLAGPLTGLAKAALFLACAEQGDRVCAADHRDAAKTMAAALPPGEFRRRLDKVLARYGTPGQ